MPPRNQEAINENMPARFTGFQISAFLKHDYYYWGLDDREKKGWIQKVPTDTSNVTFDHHKSKGGAVDWYYQILLGYYYPISLKYQFNHLSSYQKKIKSKNWDVPESFSSLSEVTYELGEQ
jgi:hypothetical protein